MGIDAGTITLKGAQNKPTGMRHGKTMPSARAPLHEPTKADGLLHFARSHPPQREPVNPLG